MCAYWHLRTGFVWLTPYSLDPKLSPGFVASCSVAEAKKAGLSFGSSEVTG